MLKTQARGKEYLFATFWCFTANCYFVSSRIFFSSCSREYWKSGWFKFWNIQKVKNLHCSSKQRTGHGLWTCYQLQMLGSKFAFRRVELFGAIQMHPNHEKYWLKRNVSSRVFNWKHRTSDRTSPKRVMQFRFLFDPLIRQAMKSKHLKGQLWPRVWDEKWSLCPTVSCDPACDTKNDHFAQRSVVTPRVRWKMITLPNGQLWSPKMYPPKLYSGPTIQSRSAARRAAQDLVLKKIQ